MADCIYTGIMYSVSSVYFILSFAGLIRPIRPKPLIYAVILFFITVLFNLFLKYIMNSRITQDQDTVSALHG